MNNIKLVVLFFFVVCNYAQSASFDCSRARSTQEKLVCEKEEISQLDSALAEALKHVAQDASAAGAKKLKKEQLKWLSDSRNRCNDAACLLTTYKSRLNVLDPYADKHITCDEMRKVPERVFVGDIDLGSGFGSPIEVDYQCPESLSEQKFLQRLLLLAEQIHGDGGPQICTGSIVHAIWRYYHFSLAEAGFSPKTLAKHQTSVRTGMNWRSSAGTGKNDQDEKIFRYFRQWSEQSPFNLQLYNNFTVQFDLVLPKLVEHYEQKHGLSRTKAIAAANSSLMLVVQRAAGSFPHQELKPDSPLVELVRDSNTTSDGIRHMLEANNSESKQYREEDIYQALVVALADHRSVQVVSSLVDRLAPEALQRLGKNKEPLLSFAIGDRASLEHLLSSKAPVDGANEFGKTALFYAIAENNHNAAQTLVNAGADVNHAYKSAKDLRPDGDECIYPGLSHTRRTPLMHAAQHSDVRMIKMLLQAHAQLDTVDDLGYNALDYASLGDKAENLRYLASLGLRFGAPKYQTGPDPKVSEHNIRTSLPVDGYVAKLLIAPGRPDLLVAAVTPWDTTVASEKHGLYFISIANPDHPKIVARFGTVYVNDFALSPDGQRAYVVTVANDNGRASRKFGLDIVNISLLEKPVLSEHVLGDFMTMHLSPDGRFLYLQERSLDPEFSRGLLVYEVDRKGTQLRCSNPFGAHQNYGPTFAYGFTSFPDETLLLIHDRSEKFLLFDMTDPCQPKKISEVRAKDLEAPIIGMKNRVVVAKAAGLRKYHFADGLELLSQYQAPVKELNVNMKTGFTTAVIGNDVAVFRADDLGGFVLTDRFQLRNVVVGNALLTDSGHVYVGWKGGLGVGQIMP